METCQIERKSGKKMDIIMLKKWNRLAVFRKYKKCEAVLK